MGAALLCRNMADMEVVRNCISTFSLQHRKREDCARHCRFLQICNSQMEKVNNHYDNKSFIYLVLEDGGSENLFTILCK